MPERKAYSVRYEAVNAMLLNEFLKEHKTVQEQAVTIASMEKQIETLTAGLEKVSAQLEPDWVILVAQTVRFQFLSNSRQTSNNINIRRRQR